MTEQDGGYAAGSLEQVLSCCLRKNRPLRLLQAEVDVGDAFATHRIESPEHVLNGMRQGVNLHRALLVAEPGAPASRVSFRVKVGDKQVGVRLHHPRELGSRTA